MPKVLTEIMLVLGLLMLHCLSYINKFSWFRLPPLFRKLTIVSALNHLDKHYAVPMAQYKA